MKALLVVVAILVILGLSGLWLAFNQHYIPDEEYLSYKDQGQLAPYQAKSQQQFNLGAGMSCILVASIISAGIIFTKTRD